MHNIMTMELLMLLLLAVLCCLAPVVLWRRRYTSRGGRGRPSANKTQQRSFIKIRSAALAHHALIDKAEAFSDRPSALFPVALVTGRRRRRSDNILSVPYGLHWRVLRCNLNSNILHPSRLAFLAPLQRAAIDGLVAGLSPPAAAGEVVVLVVRGHIYSALFGLVARMCFGEGVFGESDSGLPAVQRVVQDFVHGVDESHVFSRSKMAKLVHWRTYRRILGSRGRVAQVFSPLIDQRRRSLSSTTTTSSDVIPYVDSLLRLVVPNEDGDGGDPANAMRALTNDEILSLTLEFLGAGTETVSACVEWTLAHLAANPKAQSKLRRELHAVGGEGTAALELCDEIRQHHRGLPYLHAVVLESLRMHPPVTLVTRFVGAEDAAEVADIAAVPDAGLLVHCIVGDIGKDGKVWRDPHEFRPERFMPGGEAEEVGPLPGPKEIKMMPFGAGRRYCPGMGLGMLHAKLYVAALVREFEWTPAAGQSVDLTEKNGFFKTMKKPLLAAITRVRRA